jgi:hypothetical protein
VGTFGLDIINDECIRPFIRKGGGGIAAWVGCRVDQDEGPMDGRHHLSAAAGGVLFVDVRLFAISNSPVYTVIVGRS